MYRYRNEQHTTRHARQNFHRVSRLGRILRVKGYRFTSARKNTGGIPVQREYVLVVGENGSCRFSGLCWGYSGEGPRGLADLITHLGAPGVAYGVSRSFRGDQDGTDWELKFEGDECVHTLYPNKAA